MKDRLVILIMTFFYTGRMPWASGTWGSLAGLLLFWALAGAPLARAGVFLALAFCGVLWGARAEKLLGCRDPRSVVIDEVAGIFPAFLFVGPDIRLIAIGFLLYRIFDIAKPFPMKQLERLPAGWGIMADDLMGGVYTGALLRLLIGINILR